MAYPVITDYFRALVAWQNVHTGLPEDQYVNNFYFRNDFVAGTPTQIVDAIEAMIVGFYSTDNGTGQTILTYLSNDIAAPQLKVYDLGAPAPRFPIVEPRTMSMSGSAASALPREVALVCSFSSGNGRRNKGRVYIGPLGTNANMEVGNAPQPLAAFRSAIKAGAENMLNSTENMTWATVSPTGAFGAPVVEGWIDNAWDTQRSRGDGPTDRVVFPTV